MVRLLPDAVGGVDVRPVRAALSRVSFRPWHPCERVAEQDRRRLAFLRNGFCMWTIKKLGYSSNPWRLLDENGNEVYENATIDHPELGKSRVSMPVCGATKQEVIDKVIDGFVRARKLLRDRTSALRIIRTWAACDHLSTHTRDEAMLDIANKCEEYLKERPQ